MKQAILSPTRTEEDKAIRRMIGDRGGCKFSHTAFNAHTDNSNTITSVTKDNLLLEIYEATY